MAIDWSKPAKERDCPLCGTETEVTEKDDLGVSRGYGLRKCPNPDCNWMVSRSGSWSSPRRQEDYPEGSIGWEMHAEDA